MSINKVILVGNVGKDPEIRYIDTNVGVANFTLATTERGFKTQNGKEVPERTEWHNIVAWRGLADLAEKYIRKGTQLYIEGKIRTRSWEKDGVKRYTTEVYADTIQLLGKRSDNPIEPLATKPESTQTVEPTNTSVPNIENEEDDLPF